MKPIRLLIDTLDSGGHIIKIPVNDDHSAYAVLDKDSWLELMSLEVNPVWYINKRLGKVIAYGEGGQWRMIDRIIADCQPYQSCFPVDNDALNLRRHNLATGHSSKAKRPARHLDYIPRYKRDTHIIKTHCTYAH
jgi:hypothetical protein